MNFAIIIPTYRRLDGKTPFYLKRCLDSVLSQSYSGFKIFLIGDYYDDQQEWQSIIDLYSGSKLWHANFTQAGERGKYQDKYTTWCCAGIIASNFALDQALSKGHEYICHIDHDDYWSIDHLLVLKKAIEQTKASWLCTKSKYGLGGYLPRINSDEALLKFIPSGGNVINSSTCYSYNKIPMRYRNVFDETGVAVPADADLWDRMNQYITEKYLKSYCINKITCFHEEEGHTFQ